MSFTEQDIKILESIRRGPSLNVRAYSPHPDKVLQCYISGELFAYQNVYSDTWRVRIPTVGCCDTVAFLAVSVDLKDTNLWAEAFGDSLNQHINVTIAANMTGRFSGDRWLVYLGDAEDGQADVLVHDALIHSAGNFGFGATLGATFGFDVLRSPGFGKNFGYGEFGFDCEMKNWKSHSLAAGSYPLKVVIQDFRGNTAVILEEVVEVGGFESSPPRSLELDSYDLQQDTFTLSFTPA